MAIDTADDTQIKQKQRAIYNSPENFFNWSWPSVPRHQFLAEREKAYDPDGKTGLIELDISDVLETPYPATIPAILARYVKVRAGDSCSILSMRLVKFSMFYKERGVALMLETQ